MKISNNSVVSFHYRLRKEDGTELENSHDGNPTLYLHGAGNIIAGLESAMKDRESGDVFSVTVGPELGYGFRQPEQQRRMPAKYLKHEGKLKPGQAVRFQTDQGMRSATVVKVGKFSVDVDMNHPLAGETLVFDIEIVDVREASDEEKAHGHAHGVGGHQH